MTTSIRDLATLVSLSMGTYSPRIIDRDETRKLNDRHGATGSPHKVIRDRLSGTTAGEILADITRIQGEIRRTFYARSVPWDDTGRRMAANNYAYDLTREIARQESGMLQAVNKFLAAWPDAEREAKAALNGGWKSEYSTFYDISTTAMREKFRVNLELEPMPVANDLRLSAPDSVIEDLIRSTEKNIQERFERGCRDAHARLIDALTLIHDKLSDQDAIFRDSLIGNLRELVDLLPALNIANDPELSRIADIAQRKILSFESPTLAGIPDATGTKELCDALRDDKSRRRDTAKIAADLIAEMKLNMGIK